MPVGNISFKPSTLSDAIDATNAPPGAMMSLQNLMPDPSTLGCFICRPAGFSLTTFGGFSSPGFISGMLVIGNLVYGTIATSRNAGKDEPFVFNLTNLTFTSVSGVTSGNVPTSPPATGPWTPPILAQVGGRVIVTHPGFPGSGVNFGWFDVSGFTETTTGNTNSNNQITGNPSILGVQPGMTISDGAVNIPANTTVLSTAFVNLSGTGTSHTNTTIDGITPNTTGMAVGQVITGGAALGIPINTTIASIVGANSITISNAATASATGSIQVLGATITMSANATGTTNSESLTIAGGTTAAPMWGAGNTDMNPLPSVPVGVAQFNGRAYYALGVNGIVFSDSGFPCRVSNNPAVQALTTSDGLAVTAIAPLMLQSPLVTSGIVGGLVAFEGATLMQQITGDQATGNLAMNPMTVATGTNAPLSIFTCELGTGFISPEGLRFAQISGSISQLVGADGSGVSLPFIYSANPSRICAAAGAGVIRITTQANSLQPVTSPVEYWYDISRQVWTGPHTLAASIIRAWGNTFVLAPLVTHTLWESDVIQSPASTFVEFTARLNWEYETLYMPDTGAVSQNQMTDTLLALSIATGTTVSLTPTDISGQALDLMTLTDPNPSVPLPFQQRDVPWDQPLVFKQLSLLATGASALNVHVGNLYMRYKELGYRQQGPVTV